MFFYQSFKLIIRDMTIATISIPEFIYSVCCLISYKNIFVVFSDILGIERCFLWTVGDVLFFYTVVNLSDTFTNNVRLAFSSSFCTIFKQSNIFIRHSNSCIVLLWIVSRSTFWRHSFHLFSVLP